MIFTKLVHKLLTKRKASIFIETNKRAHTLTSTRAHTLTL